MVVSKRVAHLWLDNKLPQNVAVYHDKHFLSYSSCGSGVQVWLTWVPLAQNLS